MGAEQAFGHVAMLLRENLPCATLTLGRVSPGARIVFATTWRLPLHVNRLHEQWKAHGFPELLAIDGKPDFREETSVPRMYRRGHEIRAWLEAHPEVTRWVVVDDERLAIGSILGNERCVFTNPDRGLTNGDAERALEILEGVKYS